MSVRLGIPMRVPHWVTNAVEYYQIFWGSTLEQLALAWVAAWASEDLRIDKI